MPQTLFNEHLSPQEVHDLVGQGADVNARDENGRTPLHVARRADHTQALLDHGADPTLRDDHGLRAVDHAFGVNLEKAQVLAQALHDREPPEPQHGPRHDAPTKALFEESLEAHEARDAIAQGANVRAQDEEGLTPLHLTKRPEVAAILLDHGADLHAHDNEIGATPLHLANPSVKSLLLERGADPNARDGADMRPLHYPCPPDVAQNLIAHGADVHARDVDGYTPLHRAHNPEKARVLLDAGADAHARGHDGRTPGDFARERGDLTMVQFFNGLDRERSAPRERSRGRERD